jgi:hypothetical protein
VSGEGPSPGKPNMAGKLRASLRHPAIAGLQHGEAQTRTLTISDGLAAASCVSFLTEPRKSEGAATASLAPASPGKAPS